MATQEKYTLIEVPEGAVPTETDIKHLLALAEIDNPDCHDALVHMNRAYMDDSALQQSTIFSALIRNDILSRIVTLLNGESSDDVKKAAVDLLTAMMSDGLNSPDPEDKSETNVGDLLMMAAVSPNEVVAKAGTAAVIQWASAGERQLSALSSTLVILSAPALLHTPAPTIEADLIPLLRKKTRVLRVLAELVRAKVEFKTVGECVDAAEQLQSVCAEQNQPQTDPENNTWEDLSVACYDFVNRSQRAGFCVHAVIVDPLDAAREREEQLRAEIELLHKENATLREELDRLRRSINNQEVYNSYTSLDDVPYTFGDGTKLVREDNRLLSKGDEYSSDSCLIGYPMENGVHRITFKVLDNPFLHVGLCDASLGFPRRGYKFSKSGKGCDVTLKYGEIRNINGSTIGYITKVVKDDTITLEVDLRSEQPDQRILRFFVNSRPQQVFISGLPPSVQFGVTIEGGRSIDFDSLEDVSEPTVSSVEGERAALWQHGEKETVLASPAEPKLSQTDLSTIPLYLSDPSKVQTEGNTIIRMGEKSYETAVFKQELSSGVYNLTFKIVTLVDFLYCGVVDSSIGFPRAGEDITFPHRGVEFRLSGGTVWEKQNRCVGSDRSAKEGDIVTMELDLRSEEPENRTLHWFINGQQYKYYFFNVPQTVNFGICMFGPGRAVEFISLDELEMPTRQHKQDEVGHPFEGDQI